MRSIQFLLALHLAALAGCGGGGDAYSPPLVAANPKECIALQKPDGAQASCPD